MPCFIQTSIAIISQAIRIAYVESLSLYYNACMTHTISLLYKIWIASMIALLNILFLIYRQAWIEILAVLSSILFLFYGQTRQAISYLFRSC